MTLLDSYSWQFPNQSGWPAGANGIWTHQRGVATTAIVSNEGTMVGDTSFNIWTYGSAGRDVVLQARYIPGSTGDLWGLVARYQNAHYYFADVGDGGQIIEIGVFNGSFNQLASTAFSFSANTAYQIKFRLEMAQLSVKAWVDGQPEPTNWNIQISDNTYVVSGIYGLGAAIGSSTPLQVDHFSVNTADFNYGPLISRNVAAYTPDNNGGANPAYFANDAVYGVNSMWRSAATPTSGSPIYLAYDLSIIASNRRGNCMLAWYNDPATDTYNPSQIGTLYFNTPKTYTIDANAAAGGGSVPGSGWVTLVTVAGNNFHSRQHAINLTGYNWVRINVTDINGSSLNMAVEINMDVHDLTPGLDDLIGYGDSIYQRGIDHSDPTLPSLINASRPARWPIIENGGIGGTTSQDGATNIAAWLGITNAHYIAIGFGTNDVLQLVSTTTYAANMQTMITAIVNAGKIPILSYIPWGSASGLSTVPNYNAKINQLLASNPTALRGPDFYTYYFNNQSLINSSDGIHPTDPAGYTAYRNLWATWLLTNIYATTLPVVARGRRGIKFGSHPGSITREQVGA